MPPTKRADALATMPNLDDWLIAQRAAGGKWLEITFALRAHGIEVTQPTVIAWHDIATSDTEPAA